MENFVNTGYHIRELTILTHLRLDGWCHQRPLTFYFFISARLEAFHAIFGRFNQCSMEAKSFWRDRPDWNASVWSQENSCKNLFSPWQHANHSPLELWRSVLSSTYLIHVVNCGVFCVHFSNIFHATVTLQGRPPLNMAQIWTDFSHTEIVVN